MDDAKIQSLFADHEFEELLQKVRTQLIPRLSNVRLDWELTHDPSEPPDEYMQRLLESFETLEKHFGDDEEAAAIIERETQITNDWIASHMAEEPDREPRSLGRVGIPDKLPSTRSIFDDIDA